MSLKHIKKGFTLIEMLIVVVIIGILAAALIPRLQSVQGRARDTKRKADLNQIGSALAVYKSDKGNFAGMTTGSTSDATTSGLVTLLATNGSYLTAVPTDSDATAWSAGVSYSALTSYGFNVLIRNSIPNSAFILMARTEVDGSSSNWVYDVTNATSGAINYSTDANSYGTVCSSTSLQSANSTVLPGGTCVADKRSTNTTAGGSLRYIYVQ